MEIEGDLSNQCNHLGCWESLRGRVSFFNNYNWLFEWEFVDVFPLPLKLYRMSLQYKVVTETFFKHSLKVVFFPTHDAVC